MASSRSSGVRIVNLRETVRALERLGVEVEDLKEAFGAISRDVTEEARGRIRVKTGATQATIRPARTKNKAVVRAGNAANPHAGILNYGWPARGIAGDAFLTGPANEAPEEHARRIDDNLRNLIRRYGL